jgi:molecular chaperone GrpE
MTSGESMARQSPEEEHAGVDSSSDAKEPVPEVPSPDEGFEDHLTIASGPDYEEEAQSELRGVGTGEESERATDEPERDELAEALVALEKARDERDEYLETLRRLQADFENYRKRTLRQQTDLLERAAEQLVVKLLPVLDALDLAEAHGAQDDSPAGQALSQVHSLLQDILTKEGLEQVGKEGEKFDPERHEAVSGEPVGGESPNTAQGEPGAVTIVAQVLRPGYVWKGRLVRPAMVAVQG